jgi:peptide-methionine (R)-S-oxide reductase
MSVERSEQAGAEAALPRELPKTEDEWRERLSPEQYYVLRQKGTERPWSGEYNVTKQNGMYHCAGCGAELFSSDTKFDSHCGWPSFTSPIAAESVNLITDTTHGMVRTEVTCKACGGHLGHVFEDGPAPTGLRYCINSLSLDLEADGK